MAAFVPKPFTPFQWEPMAGLKLIKARLARVRKALSPLANLKVSAETPKYAQLQAVIARGDRRVWALVAALARGESLPGAYAVAGVDPEFYAQRARAREEFLPWSMVDHAIDPDHLWGERQRAFLAKESPECAPATCRRCGVCG
jgi:radical SAM superfamily enzyme YgiQ (UPF0313 family)